MALCKCPSCEQMISDKAIKCPHCGYENKPQIFCPECNSPVEISDSECPHCGFALKKQIKLSSLKPPKISKKNKIIMVVIAILLSAAFAGYNAIALTDVESKHVSSLETSIDKLSITSSKTQIQQLVSKYEGLSSKEKFHVSNKRALFDIYNTRSEQDINEVVNLISGLNLEHITLDNQKDVDNILSAYEKLTDAEKSKVSNFNNLEKAKLQIDQLLVTNVINSINSLPNVDSITLDNQSDIQSAQKLYNSLDKDLKNQVTNITKLESSVEAIDQAIGKAFSEKIKQYSPSSKVEYWHDNAIKALENEYASLTSKQKSYVSNYQALKSARSKCDSEIEKQKIAAKTLKIGSTVNAKHWQITLSNAQITNAIYPADTSGYYSYRHPSEGNLFVDLVFTLKNTSSATIAMTDAFDDVSLSYGGNYTYTSHSMMFSTNSFVEIAYDWDGIAPLHSQKVHVVFSVPAEVKNSSKSLVATLSIDGEEKIINIR